MNGALDNLGSLWWLWPELLLSVAVLAVLLIDLVAGRPRRARAAAIAIGALVVAMAWTIYSTDGEARGLFGGLLARDPLADFFKLLVWAGTALAGVAALRTRDAATAGIDHARGPHRDKESAELYALLLAAAVGMSLMAAATDLLMAYLSLELVSIASYVLAGFKRRDRRSSEAALKYVVYGGVASGVMVYGMSLLYGLAGSTGYAAIAQALASTEARLTAIAAVTMVLAGFGYKVAAVPFHMWCPDVYEGAPTVVTAFLSVAPKAAGFALLVRFFGSALPPRLAGAAGEAAPWPFLVAVLAAASMTLGNLAALLQSNVKRMLAYSSIANAGYLLLGLCAQSDAGVRAILLYLVTYLFMNLGAFWVVIGLEDAGVGEAIADYRGLGYRAPLPAAAMTICLMSLTGIPPLAGFFGKFHLFAALVETGGALPIALALLAVLNSAVSLYYYARVLQAMYFEAPISDGNAQAAPLRIAPLHVAGMSAMAAGAAGLFLAWPLLVRLASASLAQWVPALSVSP